jgi:SAM-dependent methyltransferase
MLTIVKSTADRVLRTVSPHWRRKQKYEAEMAFWRDMHRELYEWWEGSRADYWGVPQPALTERVVGSSWLASAILTLHAMRPTYWEELRLPVKHFAGQRILEIGCGPLIPCLQFAGCERHGLDPLIDLYRAAGFPLTDFDAILVNGYAEAIPYPDHYFDSVISVNALDHVDDFERAAAEMTRVTKPDGGLYIEVEYHAPTTTEPVVLTDERVQSAFSAFHMTPIVARTGRQMFAALTSRFRLCTTERTIAAFRDTRFVTWHGRKRRRDQMATLR